MEVSIEEIYSKGVSTRFLWHGLQIQATRCTADYILTGRRFIKLTINSSKKDPPRLKERSSSAYVAGQVSMPLLSFVYLFVRCPVPSKLASNLLS
jgi:hypothetical protein